MRTSSGSASSIFPRKSHGCRATEENQGVAGMGKRREGNESGFGFNREGGG